MFARARILGTISALALVLLPSAALAGAFIRASESTPDVIMHPIGYTGTGGVISLDVCVVTGTPDADLLEVSVENTVDTWNAMLPTTGNRSSGSGNDIPPFHVDVESVVLHEVGHCALGLAHPNLASESGLTGEDREFTKSTNGSGGYDLGAGTDGQEGSEDDQRGDDENLHWFRISSNDPFDTSLPATIDNTTYSKDLGDLPGGDDYAANADRDVSVLYGYGITTEAVMQQGTSSDEAQRSLVADDVATARLGMAGKDETQGNSDDYTVTLTYIGQAADCDIPVSFNDSQTSFAVCKTSSTLLGGSTHRRITSADIYLNTGSTWFFAAECGDGVVAGNEDCDDGGTTPGDGCDDVCEIEDGWICTGTPSSCSEDCGDGLIVGSETCDDGGTTPGDGCDASCQLEAGWNCSGEPTTCSEICGDTMVVGAEQCDDGGTAPGDCCDAVCMFESNGSPCDADGNACTAPDTCDGAGTCDVGPALSCDDSNVCTDDSCDTGTGCVNTNNTAPCDDGDACTTPDLCSGGSCVPGAPLVCNDSNACTDDSCNMGLGCVFTNNSDPCDADMTACTDPDVCSGGVCTAGPVLNCDDADECTADSCDAILGCVNEAIPFCPPTGIPSATPWARGVLAAMLVTAAGLLLAPRTRRRSS